MPSSSRSAACDQCQTQLPEGASFCPTCGRAADSTTSGTRRLDATIHEGDRLALGKTLLSGLALYEVLLGARIPGRRARSATPARRFGEPSGNVIDAAAEVRERATAPDGVDSVRAEVVAETVREQVQAARLEQPFHEDEQAFSPEPSRVSVGTMWRWERLRELVDEQARSSPTRDRRSEPRVSTQVAPRPLLRRPVRVALAVAFLIVALAAGLAFMR
jgi:hypothetical protein